jgi:hypothetical protein
VLRTENRLKPEDRNRRDEEEVESTLGGDSESLHSESLN